MFGNVQIPNLIQSGCSCIIVEPRSGKQRTPIQINQTVIKKNKNKKLQKCEVNDTCAHEIEIERREEQRPARTGDRRNHKYHFASNHVFPQLS